MQIVPVQSAEVQYEQTIKGLLTLPKGYTNKLPWVGSDGVLATLVDKVLSLMFKQYLLCELMTDTNISKLTFIRGFYKHHAYLTGFAMHLLNQGLALEAARGSLGKTNAVIHGIGLGDVFIPKWCLRQLLTNGMPKILGHYAEDNAAAIKQLDVLKNAIHLEHTGVEAKQDGKPTLH